MRVKEGGGGGGGGGTFADFVTFCVEIVGDSNDWFGPLLAIASLFGFS